MPRVIIPPADLRELIRERRESGGDRFDEVWDGVYVMSPLADNEHQDVATRLSSAFIQATGSASSVLVLAGTNVSDRAEHWKQNYRCPDVALFLPDNPAIDRGTHWLGGPDLAVEIVSRSDRSRKKFDFYQSVGVRELMLVDRHPWSLELYRNINGQWILAGKSEPSNSTIIASAVLPVTFQMTAGEARPRIVVAQNDGTGKWLV